MADSYNASSKAYRTHIAIHSTIRLIVCIIITIIALLPIYIMIVNSTRESQQIITNGTSLIPGLNLIENFKTLFDKNGIYYDIYQVGRGYANSLIISISSTALTVFFSGFTAYGLTVYDFKLRNGATVFILAVMMIPMQVVSTGFCRFMADLKLLDNYLPLILPAIAAPSVVFFMLQYMKSSFPLEIVEAARIDGSGEFRTFIFIAIPMLVPAFAVQAIFAFVSSWNNYYTPSMILISNFSQKTMPMMVNSVLSYDKSVDYGANYLAITLSILPVVIVYLALSKFIIKGVALGAVKG